MTERNTSEWYQGMLKTAVEGLCGGGKRGGIWEDFFLDENVRGE